MEPADHRQDEGSRNSYRLTCSDVAVCERRVKPGFASSSDGLVKVRKTSASLHASSLRDRTDYLVARSDQHRAI